MKLLPEVDYNTKYNDNKLDFESLEMFYTKKYVQFCLVGKGVYNSNNYNYIL